ncbi:hypothetical protein OG912_38910 (plasmid) [Streptomyces sp. NBC_00464]|uniref:hypothetical protein n=1 Tax=Streptomyces sp. NBC_00464 TaxID=2975751 RepID=UPI002E191809
MLRLVRSLGGHGRQAQLRVSTGTDDFAAGAAVPRTLIGQSVRPMGDGQPCDPHLQLHVTG